jgi:hypothetical protein
VSGAAHFAAGAGVVSFSAMPAFPAEIVHILAAEKRIVGTIFPREISMLFMEQKFSPN